MTLIAALTLTGACGMVALGTAYYRAYRKLRRSLAGQLNRGTAAPPSVVQRWETHFTDTPLGQTIGHYTVQAGLPATPLRYGLLLTAGLLIFLWFGTSFLQIGWLGSLSLSPVLIVLLSRHYLHRRRQQFLRKLQGQLPDVALAMANALRAGQSIQQAMEFVGENMTEPTRTVFHRVAQELRLQRPMAETLMELAERYDSPDFRLMISVILLQKDIGGNLIAALDQIAATIAQRESTLGEVQATLAQAEQTVRILPYIPFLSGLMFNVAVSGFLKPLFTTIPGLILLGAMILAQLLVTFLTRQLLRIEV